MLNNNIYNSKLGFSAARFDFAENITTGMSEPLLELNEDELLRERRVPSTVTESQLPSRSLNAEASNSTNQPRQDLVDTFQLF
jgi:hypothetical protein